MTRPSELRELTDDELDHRLTEGREQPPVEPTVEPTVETTPAPVADAPDTTTPKQQTEDPTKQEKADT